MALPEYDADTTSTAFAEWQSWVGERVRVTFCWDPLVQHDGKLLRLTTEGEADVQEDIGLVVSGWPALKVERMRRDALVMRGAHALAHISALPEWMQKAALGRDMRDVAAIVVDAIWEDT